MSDNDNNQIDLVRILLRSARWVLDVLAGDNLRIKGACSNPLIWTFIIIPPVQTQPPPASPHLSRCHNDKTSAFSPSPAISDRGMRVRCIRHHY